MDNKTKTLNKMLKTTQSEINNTAKDYNQNLIGSFTQRLLNRPSSFHRKSGNNSQTLDKRKDTKKRIEDNKIKQENLRLVAKILQIKKQKSRFQQNSPSFIQKIRENPEKNRQIQQQNKRLGKSLIMIHTGKSAERIKTEFNQKIQKILKKKLTKKQSDKYNLFLEEKNSIILPKLIQGTSISNDRYRI